MRAGQVQDWVISVRFLLKATTINVVLALDARDRQKIDRESNKLEAL
jgi:hypothetical protein